MRGLGVAGAVAAAALACAAAGAQPATRPASAAGAGRGPVVTVMVVGRTATLMGARTVTAATVHLRVGGRRCTVASGTPLAALAGARHAGGPAFALRDYGRCGRSPRDAAGLFVTTIGGERNRGADGWVYKVGHVAGTQGAGDVLGPLGNGHRIATGQRVLWFWCTHTRGQSGCEPTLEVTAPTAVAPTAPVTATVTAYDDNGHATPAAGATVSIGGATATAGADGRASLTAPAAPGAYAATAAQAGEVPAFPAAVTVR